MEKKKLSLQDVVKKTQASESTVKNWSSRGFITRPEKISRGRRGFKGEWQPQVIDEIRAIKRELKNERSIQRAVAKAYEKLGYKVTMEGKWGHDRRYDMIIEQQGMKPIFLDFKKNALEKALGDRNVSTRQKEAIEAVLEKHFALFCREAEDILEEGE